MKEIVEYHDFNSEPYSREELTAEMGANYLFNYGREIVGQFIFLYQIVARQIKV